MSRVEEKGSIQTKLLGGVLATVLFLTVVFALILVISFRQNQRLEALRTVQNSKGIYEMIMKNDTKMLSAALDSFATNEAVRAQFADRPDRPKLFAAVQELFQNNRAKHGITHFYFIDPEGVCYLRVHKREQFGDSIGRETLVRAKRTGATASGIELGKNVFALRVVSPYRHNGQLVGFLEFAEEIEHFDALMKQDTGIEVAVVVDKQFLHESDYRQARKAAGQRDDWDDLKGSAVVSATLSDRELVAKGLAGIDPKTIHEPVQLGLLAAGDRILAKGAFPLRDAGGRQVGMVFTLGDVTAQEQNQNKALLLLGLASLVVLGLSFLLMAQFMRIEIIRPLVDLSTRAIEISMGNVEKKLESGRDDEIGRLIRSFERMRVSLKKSMAMLAKRGTET